MFSVKLILFVYLSEAIFCQIVIKSIDNEVINNYCNKLVYQSNIQFDNVINLDGGQSFGVFASDSNNQMKIHFQLDQVKMNQSNDGSGAVTMEIGSVKLWNYLDRFNQTNLKLFARFTHTNSPNKSVLVFTKRNAVRRTGHNVIRSYIE